mmetsp:Transcript_3745/g.9116  ORF Transcript_3745/g.9116 Transcript_3745/m.9116 type:complete len:244 (+) Transcript_3745:2278-3009(+)
MALNGQHPKHLVFERPLLHHCAHLIFWVHQIPQLFLGLDAVKIRRHFCFEHVLRKLCELICKLLLVLLTMDGVRHIHQVAQVVRARVKKLRGLTGSFIGNLHGCKEAEAVHEHHKCEACDWRLCFQCIHFLPVCQFATVLPMRRFERLFVKICGNAVGKHTKEVLFDLLPLARFLVVHEFLEPVRRLGLCRKLLFIVVVVQQAEQVVESIHGPFTVQLDWVFFGGRHCIESQCVVDIAAVSAG